MHILVSHITADSVILQWDVSNMMHNFPFGFHHRVMYRVKDDNEISWQVGNNGISF